MALRQVQPSHTPLRSWCRYAVLALLLACLPAASVHADGANYPGCLPGSTPTAAAPFQPLIDSLGGLAGDPLECASAVPPANTQVQRTSTGILRAPGGDALPTFTAGDLHWALRDDAVVTWRGGADQPSANAEEVDPQPQQIVAAGAPPATRASAINGRFLLVSAHGALFHSVPEDFAETAAYAHWLGAGAVRVFATDSRGMLQWDGREVGQRILDAAPSLRRNNVKLVVALVNNHRPVPGEAVNSSGYADHYLQLLLPFFTTNWQGTYHQFAQDLVRTVRDGGGLDVIQAWELGNELHTPTDPPAIIPFITAAVQMVRQVDPSTPIWPGTMGANHLQPWQPESPIARWLYCQAPVDAYTLHAYDWVSEARQGDMPILWDLESITARPCPSGRQIPVIVEELGTSRALPGVYSDWNETARLQQELRQISFVLAYPQVQGLGVWNGESPLVKDHAYSDSKRGLTSWGPAADGSGSCYAPSANELPGMRCRLEQALRRLPAAPS